MIEQLPPTDLGEPDLKVAGFLLWVHGRQFPEVEDYHDGNWLRVTAHCSALGASVWAHGALLSVADVAEFGDGCAAMLRGESRSVGLVPFEPELKVSLEVSDSVGHICAQVEITPDHLSQSHRFEFEVDQSYLPDIIKQCLEIMQEYPSRGRQDGRGV